MERDNEKIRICARGTDCFVIGKLSGATEGALHLARCNAKWGEPKPVPHYTNRLTQTCSTCGFVREVAP